MQSIAGVRQFDSVKVLYRNITLKGHCHAIITTLKESQK